MVPIIVVTQDEKKSIDVEARTSNRDGVKTQIPLAFSRVVLQINLEVLRVC